MTSTQTAAGSQAPGTLHVPVMLAEVLEALQPCPGKAYIDATAGGGGHSQAILDGSAPDGRVLSLDVDPQAVERVRARLRPYGDRAEVVHANFRDLGQVARRKGFSAVDGILIDLGFSSDQLGDAGRGFSLTADGPLDMRFDPAQPITAADLVNRLDRVELANLLYRYGEETHSRRIADAIIRERPLHTAAELAAVIARVLPERRAGRGTGGRGRNIDPATRTFQALRIAVNEELAALTAVLPQTIELLRPGGRLAVIAFHSLEDRIVKQFMQQEAKDCICPPELPICSCQHKASLRLLGRKPLQPSAAEIARNPRSRSARLRVAERLPVKWEV